MQSLSKIALEKGLIKLDDQIKTAAPKVAPIDLNPTNNFTQNVIKLCAGLRESGFANYANELETHLVNYKKAQSLYHTSNETGEDVIEEAHPNGSTKLDGIDSDEAVVEDILDKHQKMVDVAEKNPTKNASAIQAVKNVFANQNLEQLNAAINQYTDQITGIFSVILIMANKELTVPLDNLVGGIKELLANPTIDNLRDAKNNIDHMKSRLNPESWMGGWGTFKAVGLSTGLSENTWEKIAPKLDKIDGIIDHMITVQTQINKIDQTDQSSEVPVENKAAPSSTSTATDPLVNKFWELTKSISLNSDRLKNIKLPDNNQQNLLTKWLEDTQKEVSEKMTQWNEDKYKSDPVVQKSFQQYYDTTLEQVNRVSNYIQQSSK